MSPRNISPFLEILSICPELNSQKMDFCLRLLDKKTYISKSGRADNLSAEECQRFLRFNEVEKFIELFEKLAVERQSTVIEIISESLFSIEKRLSILVKGQAKRAAELIKRRFIDDEPKSGSVLLAMAIIHEKGNEMPTVYSTSRIAEVMREALKDLPTLDPSYTKLGPFIKSMTSKSLPEVVEVGRGEKNEWILQITSEGLQKLQSLLTEFNEE